MYSLFMISNEKCAVNPTSQALVGVLERRSQPCLDLGLVDEAVTVVVLVADVNAGNRNRHKGESLRELIYSLCASGVRMAPRSTVSMSTY